ncbi:MAG: hypothetical protein BWX70_01790 [Verrucomicrobia bacterium ADurb.Bin070]|nr:MAG: hypothetical protein BWX70_01790 [Verrucomicrobia bacterium ADurb.Bin070]
MCRSKSHPGIIAFTATVRLPDALTMSLKYLSALAEKLFPTARTLTVCSAALAAHATSAAAAAT